MTLTLDEKTEILSYILNKFMTYNRFSVGNGDNLGDNPTQLENQHNLKNCDSVNIVSGNIVEYNLTLALTEAVGLTINQLGLFDSSNNLKLFKKIDLDIIKTNFKEITFIIEQEITLTNG